MLRKLTQKQRDFGITEILRRRNFDADTERGGANRGISVYESNCNYNFFLFTVLGFCSDLFTGKRNCIDFSCNV